MIPLPYILLVCSLTVFAGYLGGRYDGANQARKDCRAKISEIRAASDAATQEALQSSASGWRQRWESERAARLDAEARTLATLQEREKARQAAAESALRLSDYLESVKDDPTACVNRTIPDAVHRRLLDAAGG